MASQEHVEELLSSYHVVFLEELYEDYLKDPSSVSAEWREQFVRMQGDSPSFARGPELPSEVMASFHSSPPAPINGSSPQQRIFDPAKELHEVETLSGEWSVVSSHSRDNLPSLPLDGDLATLDERVQFLKALSLLSSMPDETIRRIAEVAKEVRYGAGECLICRGDDGRDLYLIMSGMVYIKRGEKVLAQLGVGEVVGELAILDNQPRSADVIAYTDVRLLSIRGDEFQRLLHEDASLAVTLLQLLASRVRVTSARQERVGQLVRSYRERGHVVARINPLAPNPSIPPELTLAFYGLKEQDLDTPFSARLGRETSIRPLKQIIAHLQRTYCDAIGVQYMHIDDRNVQEWLRVRIEENQNHHELLRDTQLRILEKLTDAEIFETFLHRQFLGAKRFSLEGAESMIPLLDQAIEKAGLYNVEEIVIGMAHRGRLNVLANVMGKPVSQIFREFEDLDPELHLGRGDVKYHMGYSSDRVAENGQPVHLSLCFNPSHLEFVGPVVIGRVRCKQDRRLTNKRKRVMGIVIHGDAAFSGQGVVQEMLNLSELPGYTVGGTIHIVVNNQIGFTTTPDDGRSCMYATDVARMLQIPIFHVNGEDPEAVNQVIRLAMDFHNTFGKDVVIDMYCYRLHGHNEGDEPNFTQPMMYQAIAKRQSVRSAYIENLLKLGCITEEETKEIEEASRARLQAELDLARSPAYEYEGVDAGRGVWTPFCGGPDEQCPEVETHVPKEKLSALLKKTITLPEEFTPHRKNKRFLKRDLARAKGEQSLDWGSAEKLAFATLLEEGVDIRVSGQDAERGTFSHRHSVLSDVTNGQKYTPLCHLSEEQGAFQIYNSPLSEIGVLGFEYGYSLDAPDQLLIWEAQFGDFCNVAQVFFDQFISSSEDKWNRLSGLCVFLPHGFEGQGPEHSSARLERFLSLAAEDNMQIVNLTTPAQLFHCIRRQVLRPWRKPLVLMSPKSLLRLPEATSSLDELAEGAFQRLIPDVKELDTTQVRRILLCSGKIYYELEAERAKRKVTDVAIIRIEQYYPFPQEQLEAQLMRYPKDTPVFWVQEEPRNMGAWPFMRLRFAHHIKANGEHRLKHITRPESASPATGSKAAHVLEQNEILRRAFTFEDE